jgi:hypothetical protein
MKSRLLLIALLASFGAFGQMNSINSSIVFESEEYFAIVRSIDYEGSKFLDNCYYLFDFGGRKVSLSSLIVPDKKEILLALLNHKLSEHIKFYDDLEDEEWDGVIEMLKEVNIDEEDLRVLEIYNTVNENGITECEIIYCNFHLYTAAKSAEPYFVLNYEECLYFFEPDLFKWIKKGG